MTEMTTKEALRLAETALNILCVSVGEDPMARTYARAAAILHDGGPVVERSDVVTINKCFCGREYEHDIINNNRCPYCGLTICKSDDKKIKRWTTREKLMIKTEVSAPIFEDHDAETD